MKGLKQQITIMEQNKPKDAEIIIKIAAICKYFE